jgi:dienelactone hydrolase
MLSAATVSDLLPTAACGNYGVVVLDQARSDQRPGVLLIHGGAGLDDHARGQAHRYAELGYVVLACDMYGRGIAGDRERVMATLMGLRDAPDLLAQRAAAGLAALSARAEVNGRLAAVGFCFGGTGLPGRSARGAWSRPCVRTAVRIITAEAGRHLSFQETSPVRPD